MSIFDLLLILLVLATAAALLLVLAALVTRHFKSAARVFAATLAVWLLYLAAGAAVALLTPQRIVPLGQDRCFDEMCFAVTGFQRVPSIASPAGLVRPNGVFLIVDVRISNQSQRHPQREAGRAGELVDDSNRVYQPSPAAIQALAQAQNPSADPLPGLDATVQPGQSLTTRLVFDIPATATHPAFVLTSHLAVNPARLVIADDAHFLHKPSIVPLY
jgi:hypothetical protein